MGESVGAFTGSCVGETGEALGDCVGSGGRIFVGDDVGADEVGLALVSAEGRREGRSLGRTLGSCDLGSVGFTVESVGFGD